MAYVALRYYRSHALEIREAGDSGWAVHVYAPSADTGGGKLGVVTTASPGGLEDAMAEARSIVDRKLVAVRHH